MFDELIEVDGEQLKNEAEVVLVRKGVKETQDMMIIVRIPVAIELNRKKKKEMSLFFVSKR